LLAVAAHEQPGCHTVAGGVSVQAVDGAVCCISAVSRLYAVCCDVPEGSWPLTSPQCSQLSFVPRCFAVQAYGSVSVDMGLLVLLLVLVGRW
jgi:hypothetical protein